MNSLSNTVTRQRRDCDLNPGPSAPESSTLTIRLPSHSTIPHNKSESVSLFLSFFCTCARPVFGGSGPNLARGLPITAEMVMRGFIQRERMLRPSAS